jgi:hypothetical protein
VWRSAPVALVDFSSESMPLCGMTDGHNITHCGIHVKGFLPLCGKKWQVIEFKLIIFVWMLLFIGDFQQIAAVR